jgi:hypothetical protein
MLDRSWHRVAPGDRLWGEAGARIATVSVEFTVSRSGVVAAAPLGAHVDWPSTVALKLVNHDIRPHALHFATLPVNAEVGPADETGPHNAFFSIPIRGPGNYPWTCSLNCQDPAPEGYIHVA